MKKIKNIILSLVCCVALFAATTPIAKATETQGSLSCYYIECWDWIICIDNGIAGPQTLEQYEATEEILNDIACRD